MAQWMALLLLGQAKGFLTRLNCREDYANGTNRVSNIIHRQVCRVLSVGWLQCTRRREHYLYRIFS